MPTDRLWERGICSLVPLVLPRPSSTLIPASPHVGGRSLLKKLQELHKCSVPPLLPRGVKGLLASMASSEAAEVCTASGPGSGPGWTDRAGGLTHRPFSSVLLAGNLTGQTRFLVDVCYSSSRQGDPPPPFT